MVQVSPNFAGRGTAIAEGPAPEMQIPRLKGRQAERVVDLLENAATNFQTTGQLDIRALTHEFGKVHPALRGRTYRLSANPATALNALMQTGIELLHDNGSVLMLRAGSKGEIVSAVGHFDRKDDVITGYLGYRICRSTLKHLSGPTTQLGFSHGVNAFVAPNNINLQLTGHWEQLRAGRELSNPYSKALSAYSSRSRISLSEFVQALGIRSTELHEEQHAKDNIFAAVHSRGEVGTMPVQAIVSHLIRPGKDHLTAPGFAAGMYEMSGRLAGTIALMEELIDAGKHELAFAAFLYHLASCTSQPTVTVESLAANGMGLYSERFIKSVVALSRRSPERAAGKGLSFLRECCWENFIPNLERTSALRWIERQHGREEGMPRTLSELEVPSAI